MAKPERDPDAPFQAGERRAIRNLEQLRRENPDAWVQEVRLRRADRLIATWHDDGTAAYAELLAQWRRLRGINDTPSQSVPRPRRIP